MAGEYLDFDLCIEKTAEGYQAEVTEPLGGKASINFSLPFSDLELENFILKVGGRRRVMRGAALPELEAAQAFGGPVPLSEFPMQLSAGASATADQVSYKIVNVALELDNEGTRANVDEHFLVLTLQILNDNTEAGNILVGSQYYRLRVNDMPLAPINSISEIVPVRSAKRMNAVFIVPADATEAELQVGQVGGTTASILVPLNPPSASPTAALDETTTP